MHKGFLCVTYIFLSACSSDMDEVEKTRNESESLVELVIPTVIVTDYQILQIEGKREDVQKENQEDGSMVLKLTEAE